jgi:hypothetical protein
MPKIECPACHESAEVRADIIDWKIRYHEPLRHIRCGRLITPGELQAQVAPPVALPAVTHEQRGGDDAKLSPRDNAKLNAGNRAVFEVLRDGQKHTREELEKVAGKEATKRARELRLFGYNLDVQRIPGTMKFTYQLLGLHGAKKP